MEDSTLKACPHASLLDVVHCAERDSEAGLQQTQLLLLSHPADPRLHFLHGSLLASKGDYRQARVSMSQAIALKPDYDVARFQLGLLELTSGNAAEAEAIFAPLEAQGADAALALFARGLLLFACDEFAAAAELLRRGIDCNDEHPAISRDMEMIIGLMPSAPADTDEDPQELSATQLLLRQHAGRLR